MRAHGLTGMTVAVLVAGAVFVSLGDVDDSVSGEAAFEVWGDVLRDVDQFGLSLTRVADREEMEIGRRMAAALVVGAAEVDPREERVAAIGHRLTEGVRRVGIKYAFHVVPGSEVQAFAFPGGQIFITTGMLDFLRSDDELAGVLGHEIAHVDQRHCIELLQTRLAMGKLGLDIVAFPAEMLQQIWAVGYRQYQEAEADAVGLRLMTRAGYDPEAMIGPLERLKAEEGGRDSPSRHLTPIDETIAVLGRSLGDYGNSHPRLTARIRRLRGRVARQSWGRRP
jgi:predicted Zn-dependent protease